jgi:hypothetical protein
MMLGLEVMILLMIVSSFPHFILVATPAVPDQKNRGISRSLFCDSEK